MTILNKGEKQLTWEKRPVRFANLYEICGARPQISVCNGVIKTNYDKDQEANLAKANVLYTEVLRCATDIHLEDGHLYWTMGQESPIINVVLKNDPHILEFLKNLTLSTKDMHIQAAYEVCDSYMDDLKKKQNIEIER